MARPDCKIDEENWLVDYLATTQYGSDGRLTLKPFKQIKPAGPKATNSLHSLHVSKSRGHNRRGSLEVGEGKGPNRRRSSESREGRGGIPNHRRPSESDETKPAGAVNFLPDRVNSIRASKNVYSRPEEGHFVREHSAEDGVVSGRRGGRKSRGNALPRRESFYYDELEAVRERLTQAMASMHNSESTSDPPVAPAPQ